MSIRIRAERCIGCRQCIALCPGNLIKWDAAGGHAYIRRPKDCWGCASCIKACPSDAIAYYLGADIGGRGTEMSVAIGGKASNLSGPSGHNEFLPDGDAAAASRQAKFPASSDTSAFERVPERKLNIWIFRFPDGSTKQIAVDPASSNQY